MLFATELTTVDLFDSAVPISAVVPVNAVLHPAKRTAAAAIAVPEISLFMFIMFSFALCLELYGKLDAERRFSNDIVNAELFDIRIYKNIEIKIRCKEPRCAEAECIVY